MTTREVIEGILRRLAQVEKELDRMRVQEVGPPGARVLKSGDQNIGAGAGAQIIGWTVDYDTGSFWNAANNQFVIQERGFYIVMFNGLIAQTARDIQARLRHRRGITQTFLHVQHHTDATPTFPRFTAIGGGIMEENDEIDMFIQNDNAGSALDVDATNTYSSYEQQTFAWLAKLG